MKPSSAHRWAYYVVTSGQKRKCSRQPSVSVAVEGSHNVEAIGHAATGRGPYIGRMCVRLTPLPPQKTRINPLLVRASRRPVRDDQRRRTTSSATRPTFPPSSPPSPSHPARLSPAPTRRRPVCDDEFPEGGAAPL
eukprot:363779-Chlamydomonas_euryale.AAC.3